MNRRMGIESHFGVGGGIVSPRAQKSLEKAEELCRKKKPEKALPNLLEAMEDDNNLDAFIQAAFLFSPREALEVLETAEQKGRAGLIQRRGSRCFEGSGPDVGHFWLILETRPYMRVLQAIVRVAFENGDFTKSANTAIEMLRLCPGDNLGQRQWLGSVLIKAGRYSDALSFAQAWLAPSADDGQPMERGGCAFESNPPFKTCLLPSRERKLSEWATGSIVYTAALACFKLFGDCTLARQYLRIAARVNPHVLMKIIAKVEKPRSLNNDPRSPNGPQEAHDYLWLTQDVWMEPDVWNWVDTCEPEAKKAVLRSCSRSGCGKVETQVAQYKKCSSCKEVWYCSQECQRLDWKTHKPRCEDTKNQRAFMRAIATGKPLPKSFKPPGMADNGPIMGTVPPFSSDTFAI